MSQVAISIFHWALGYLVFGLGGLVLIITTFLPPERLRYWGAILLSRAILLALGIRLRAEGKYPTDQAYIFMPNHGSFVDIFVLAAILRDRFTGVMAEEQLKYPYWNLIFNRFRAISIRRGDREAAIAAIQEAEDRLKRGYQVGIMPEGTRTLDGKIGPLKKGGFHMALNTGAPILPIGIDGTFRFKPKHTWLLRPGPVYVRIGTPIPAERYQQMSMEATMAEVRRQLQVLTGEIDAK